MRTVRTLITSSLFLLVCAVGAFAQTVQTDYDHNFNLSKLKTYTFAQQVRRPGDPLAASPINDRRIHDGRFNDDLDRHDFKETTTHRDPDGNG